jgi:hypothetical protein
MRAPRRWLSAVLAPCLTLCLVLAGPAVAPAGAGAAAPAMAADASTEAAFVAAINDLRASRGLHLLQVSGPLTGVARAWTDHMAAAGSISHNPSLSSQVGGGWTKLGENVGVGYDVPGLMQAFVGSPAHLANLVDPTWTHVGVGVTTSGDGRLFTTHNFMAATGSAPPPPPPPAPSPPTTAAPAPPTTVPPTTTTTAPPPPPPAPKPTVERVAAVLDPLRSLEAG